MQHPQDEKTNGEDANPGNSASVSGSTGPGSVVGSGSVQADIIAGGGVTINRSNDTELDKIRERLFVTGDARRIDVERWVEWYRKQGKRPELYGAKLAGLALNRMNLEGVDLREADLKKASLRGANLREANLWSADLRAADLQMANLTLANLAAVKLKDTHLNKVILPDGILWTETTDLHQFTNRQHPDFWRPNRDIWWLDEGNIPWHG